MIILTLDNSMYHFIILSSRKSSPLENGSRYLLGQVLHSKSLKLWQLLSSRHLYYIIPTDRKNQGSEIMLILLKMAKVEGGSLVLAHPVMYVLMDV